MALVRFGSGMLVPGMPRASTTFADGNSSTANATGQKLAFVGRMRNRDGATKTLVGVGILFGTVVKAGGSDLTVSQQGVDATSLVPFQPDGVAAQSWAVADSAYTSTTWTNTGDNAGVSVAYGAPTAIVVEFDGGGRLGADSFQIRGYTASDVNLGGGTVYHNGTSWALTGTAILPNVVLKFSDGTYGTLEGGLPHSSSSAVAVNTGTTPDEVALEFTVPAPVTVDGAWMALNLSGTSADFDVVLYDGSTALATVSQDANSVAATASGRFFSVPLPPTDLTAGPTYRLALKPTTANSVSLSYFDFNLAAHRQAFPGFGASGAYATRADAGSWTTTTTRIPLMGLRVIAVSDGTGGGAAAAPPPVIRSNSYTFIG